MGLYRDANQNDARTTHIMDQQVQTVSSDILYFTEQGSGPPLLLIHGLMVTGEMFEPVVAHVAERHRVIIPDLRGHGRSRSLPPSYSVMQHANDLAQLLDHLGVASTAVLGYSQGGAVAQQLVLDHPQRCRRLILVCTYAFNMATVRERLEGYLTPVILRLLGMKRFAKLVISQGLKNLPSERARQVAAVIAGQDRKLMIIAWKEVMKFDSREHLREISCPVLIVAGTNDEAAPLHHSETLHKHIQGSKLATIEGANHALIWTHSHELMRMIEEFV
jgi:pimeloyl-ACP methyl ester carboxylesterase